MDKPIKEIIINQLDIKGLEAILKKYYPIYPTPPLGQDMTQGQFFKQSLTGFNSEFSFP